MPPIEGILTLGLPQRGDAARRRLMERNPDDADLYKQMDGTTCIIQWLRVVLEERLTPLPAEELRSVGIAPDGYHFYFNNPARPSVFLSMLFYRHCLLGEWEWEGELPTPGEMDMAIMLHVREFMGNADLLGNALAVTEEETPPEPAS